VQQPLVAEAFLDHWADAFAKCACAASVGGGCSAMRSLQVHALAGHDEVFESGKRLLAAVLAFARKG
jgi:hypothetical protein